MSRKLKFAVVGSGAIGCYYGGMLASQGGDVHFLMRRDLEFVRRNGLRLHSGGEKLHISKVNVSATTDEIGPSDVVLIAVKTTSNKDLGKLIPPLLKDDTILLTLQNGLGNEEFLATRFGAERVMGGLCFVCLNRIAPGVIEHYGHGTLSIGEYNRGPLPRTHHIVAEFQQSGIVARVVENLITERWRKLVWNIPFNGLSIAAGKITVADILADAPLHQITLHMMEEVIGAAKKAGHDIPMSFIEEQIQRSIVMGPYKPSSLIDYMEGREVEVESIWGEPYRQGLRAGAEVGRMETLYGLLKKLAAHVDRERI
jgi:2-dehydropantoate 2-reductase